MTSPATLRAQYVAERPTYEALAAHIQASLKQGLRARGVQGNVDARAKDVASFMKKALRKAYVDPLAQTTDKAGVRVVVLFPNLLQPVDEAIHELFVVHKIEDKRYELGTDRFGYLSKHYDVMLRAAPSDRQALLGLPCEVQTRTLCQNVFAEMAHVMTYKADFTIPDETQRRINGLSALLEIADREFQAVYGDLLALPGFETARLRNVLETEYFKFAGNEVDPELTDIVVETIAPLLPSADQLQAVLAAFLDHHRERVELVFRNYQGIDAPTFLSQPESMALFYLLERDQYQLAELWGQRLPDEELDALARAWGTPLAIG